MVHLGVRVNRFLRELCSPLLVIRKDKEVLMNMDQEPRQVKPQESYAQFEDPGAEPEQEDAVKKAEKEAEAYLEYCEGENQCAL